MLSDDTPTPSATPPSIIEASIPFDGSDNSADIILRSADNMDFHVHKLILSMASPVFKTMFCLPTPSDSMRASSINCDEMKDGLPVITLSESALIIDLFLRTLYPTDIPDFHFTDFMDIYGLLQISRKYDVSAIRHIVRSNLRLAVEEEPLKAYLLAMLYELGDVAEKAAVACLRLPLASLATQAVPFPFLGDHLQQLLLFYLNSWKVVSNVTMDFSWFRNVGGLITMDYSLCNSSWAHAAGTGYYAHHYIWEYLSKVHQGMHTQGVQAITSLDSIPHDLCTRCPNCTFPDISMEPLHGMLRKATELKLTTVSHFRSIWTDLIICLLEVDVQIKSPKLRF
ncbi:hypothetical protein OF83DRAFT_1069743 [Amylostereum chailletii]|nr:hypothetical protein OF83DRAFT_1069743 [Amylostereum chailletii]